MPQRIMKIFGGFKVKKMKIFGGFKVNLSNLKKATTFFLHEKKYFQIFSNFSKKMKSDEK